MKIKDSIFLKGQEDKQIMISTTVWKEKRKKENSMSVKKRKNRKNWSANWRDIQGVQRQKTFKTQNEAKEFERQMLIQKNKGIQVNVNQGKRPLQDFYLEWINSKIDNVRPKSLLQYENSWDVYIKSTFGQDVLVARSLICVRLRSPSDEYILVC